MSITAENLIAVDADMPTVAVPVPRPAPNPGAAAAPPKPVARPPVDPHEPPKLDHEQLVRAQLETLAAPRRKYSIAARLLFLIVDLVYGRRRSLLKYRVLEVVARTPYQTWEAASYRRLSKVHRNIPLAKRIAARVQEFRAQQDNEQWHLLILDELVEASGAKQGRLRQRLFPRLMAWSYWQFSTLLYVLKPKWSFRLNADFEDHAEHEYAEFVRAHPEFEYTPYSSVECAEYGTFASLADLLRQIGHDERCHKAESEIHLQEPKQK
jgi:ubiquinol oxidase